MLTCTEADADYAMSRIVKRCGSAIDYCFTDGRLQIWPASRVRRGKVIERYFHLEELILIPQDPIPGDVIIDYTGSFVSGAGSQMMLEDVRIEAHHQPDLGLVRATSISVNPNPHFGLQDGCIHAAARWLNTMLWPPRDHRSLLSLLPSRGRPRLVGAATSLFRFS